MRPLALSLLVAALAMGCDRGASEGAAPAPAAEAAAPAAAAAAPAEAAAPAVAEAPAAAAADAGEPSEEEVPVAEDFEDESEQAITADNYRAALDQLASEIGSPASH